MNRLLLPITFALCLCVLLNTSRIFAQSIETSQNTSLIQQAQINKLEKQRNIFLSVSFFLVVVLAFGLYQRSWSYRRFKRSINEKDELIQKQKDKLEQAKLELEIRMLKAQLNPDLVQNSLHSIQELINQRKSNEAISYLTGFSTLLSNVLSSTIKLNNTLDEEISLLKSYIELESTRVNGSFSYDIEIGESLNSSSIRVPTLLLQPLVEHALHSDSAANGNKKKLVISFQELENLLRCDIRSYFEGNQSHNGEQKKHLKSHAAHVSEQRIKLIAEKYKVDARIQYDDHAIDNDHVAGKSIKIFLPKIEE